MKKWKIWLLAIIILPCMMFFGGCSCDGSNNNNTKSNITYTVMFYTGVPNIFDVGNQEIKKGGLVRDPNIARYYFDGDVSYKFDGWYSDPSFEDQYYWKFATDEVHENLTLYAKWERRN